MSTQQLILAVLATYRLAHMAAYEDGPADVFGWLRTAALRRFGKGSWVTRGVNCPLCISFWLAWLMPFLPHFALLALGIAGAVLVTHTALTREGA